MNEIRGLDIPEPFYNRLIIPKRIKVFSGGRGSAKSESVARGLLLDSCQNRGRVLCTREYQNSITDSVHKVLLDIIEDKENGLTHLFDYNKQTIINKKTGTDFIFKGLQDIAGIKSMKGITKAWCEESQTLTMPKLEILVPTIREPNSELIFTLNREEEKDAVIEKFCSIPDDDVMWFHSTFRDNPYFPDVLRKEMLKDKERDYNLYLHIWEGEPRKNKGNLFDLTWFDISNNIPCESDFDYRFMTADTAYKDKQENDYTVFTYWGVLKGKLYLIDIIRKQINAIDIENWCVPFIVPKLSYGFRNVWIEPKGHGIYLNQSLPKYKIPIPTDKQVLDTLSRRLNKVERANNVIPFIDKNNKNVIINGNIEAGLLRDLKQELVFFPNSKHDDIVDTIIDGIKIGLAETDYVAQMKAILGMER